MSATLSRAVPGLRAFAGYRRSWLSADLLAGATLWAMLVPQSLGFAVLAGLPPVIGLYTAVGAMITYLWWGSSRVLNVGAESTVALMVATTLTVHASPGSEEYVDLAVVLALLVGLFLVIGGLLGLGRAADFLSRPVLAGYVFGSGVLIVSSQLEGFVGASIDPTPYLTEVGAVVRNLDQADLTAVCFGAVSLILVLALRRFLPAVPGALIAVAGSIAVVAAFDVDVTVVGAFDSGLPSIGLPAVGLDDVGMLVGPALAIALLVYPDSALTARSLTVGTPDRIDADREFFGVGAANLGAGLLGGFPVNGSQSRSFVLRDAGARSQVANLVAAALVVLTLVALAPIFDYLPTATLAAIVIVAGISLFDVAEFQAFWRYRRSEFWTAVATVAAVLGLGMLVGIAVAIGLTMLLMVLRAADATGAVLGRLPGTDTYRDIDDHVGAVTVPGLLLYRFDAPLFFANAGRLRDEVLALQEEQQARCVVLDLETTHDIDSSAIQVLHELLDELDRRGVSLELARVRTEVHALVRVGGVEERLADRRVHLEVDDAVTSFQQRNG
ncbi:SulP family inorganic anion transporter [Nocardioides sp. BGMRC 2183]|nr:SulP family inorganic anion transporter [Nocardioides sp. BGMRC 2183]